MLFATSVSFTTVAPIAPLLNPFMVVELKCAEKNSSSSLLLADPLLLDFLQLVVKMLYARVCPLELLGFLLC